MDDTSDKVAGLGLPPPAMGPADFVDATNSSFSAGGDMPQVLAPGAPLGPPPASGAEPAAGPIVPTSAIDQPLQPVAPPIGDDNADALDEEWVTKAKTIVEQTKADPFAQSNKLSKMKADYLRIRYNKQVKVSEDQAQ